ncbi:dihydrolipoyl dehydrogenase [Candidatus Hodarchaeum mangrovi]
MEIQETDVLIIGGGPGGYPASIRAAQLGKKVILVEKEYLGGECLNWGCIPSKALISAAGCYYRLIHEAEEMGISVKEASFDVKKIQAWKNSVQIRLINGIKQLLKGNNVELIIGTASFISPSSVLVLSTSGTEFQINAKDIIIATGANFISLPGFIIDEETIVTAKGALNFEKLPRSLCIIGGGVIGIELGSVYAKLGVPVSIIELLPEILPGVDPLLTRTLKMRLKKLGISIYTSSRAKPPKRLETGEYEIIIDTKKGEQVLRVDKILVAVGKRGTTTGLKLENSNVLVDNKGFIQVNKRQQTSQNSIYAVGDCTGPPFLAHRATKQGIIAAEVIAGLDSKFDFKSIPSAIFTDPEISFTGLSETEAIEAGYDVISGKASFGASGRAITHQSDFGFVKVVGDKNTGQLLGVQIIGPNASDLISEATLGLELGATLEDLGYVIHPHPTLPEMIMEAAEAALGKAIHQINIQKRD